MRSGSAMRAAAVGAGILLLAAPRTPGLRVYVTPNANEADLIAFQPGQANESDLLVYAGPGGCEFSGPGRWCYVANPNEAEVRVHFAAVPDMSDLKVWFVDNENQAGWYRPPHDIVSSPGDTGAFPGRQAVMRVRAFLAADVEFQWQRLVGEAGWVDIPGATADSLVLSGDDAGALGAYRVRVSSARGSLYSRIALFRLLALPRFHGATGQPGGVFRLEFSGEPGFGYVVERSDDLVDWFLVEAVAELTGEGATVEDDVGAAVRRRVYRIRVLE